LFQHGPVAALAAGIDRAYRATADMSAARLGPLGRDERPPLSFAQQRLWFFDQLEPHSPLYNVPVAVRLGGPLDMDALRRSLVGIIERHEILRTTFAARDGQPYQVIAPVGAQHAAPLLDLQALPEAEREAAALRLARTEARQPFDLSTGPLLRSTVLRLADEEHVLLLTMHHIVSDGWSMGVLIEELAALYESFVAGRPAALPALP